MKKSLLLAMSLLLVICLASCGGNSAHSHEFGNWVTKENPTCTENGLRVGSCSCGEKETEDIPAIRHSYINWVCSVCGYADPDAESYSEGLSFVSNGDGSCYVAGIGSCTDTDIVIPLTTAQGEWVTAIADEAFSGCYNITSVVIPDSVITIGVYAFSGCSGLTSVVIPESVTPIDNWTFFNCSSLTSVVIPDSVTYIGMSAFQNCSGLTSVVIGDSVTTIDNWAFRDCSSLTSVVIPDSVTYIGDSVFQNCSGLTSVVIGDSVTYIGDSAFYRCTGLTSVVIGDSVTTIGDYAFYACPNLKDVYYTGSEEEWGAITISSYNSNLTNATKHYNYVAEE